MYSNVIQLILLMIYCMAYLFTNNFVQLYELVPQLQNAHLLLELHSVLVV